MDTLAMVRVLYDDDTEPVAKTRQLIAEWQQLSRDDAADNRDVLPTVGVVLRALLCHAQSDIDEMFAEAHVDALAKVAEPAA